ncbi:alpha/beta hydrolase [Zoogloea oryzae]|uniref:Alpha/beta hydrolase n=1 Tax=Zoogloea oryzae TaxID=310767 RepID=A0ABQ6F614_9RHOO|nr:alpha/beta hydrolase [Zoogloea oryzae]GLT20992.1 alpha/beta hydrolase [Zoogloea oryzae]
MKLTLAGRDTYVYTGGRAFDAARPTIVFIHGAGHDHSVWTLQSRYFATHGWNPVVPDLPGHGQSAGPQLTSIEAIADWVLALLDGLGVATATLAGHSMGSLVALQAASRAPERVRSLVLVGSVAPMPVAPPLLDATLAARDKAHRMINQWSYAPGSQLGASSIPGLNLTAINERLMQRAAPGVLHTDMSACNAYTGGFDAAARVTCPVLLLSAAQDRMTPPKAIAPLANAFTSARKVNKVVLSGAGHAMMAEAPGAVLDAIWQFADSNRSSEAVP